ncbi:hypothetical protein AHAS_Ahas11G0038300 [Arachis hypogaea]
MGNEIGADENQGVLRKPELVKSLWNLKKEGFPLPDVLSVNCTSLANTSDIFTKVGGNQSIYYCSLVCLFD